MNVAPGEIVLGTFERSQYRLCEPKHGWRELVLRYVVGHCARGRQFGTAAPASPSSAVSRALMKIWDSEGLQIQREVSGTNPRTVPECVQPAQSWAESRRILRIRNSDR